MQSFSYSPAAIARSLRRNRSLIKELAKREVVGRYRGSVVGIVWSFFLPLLMLGIYSFVFGGIFKSRWEGAGGSGAEFPLILFAGLIVYNFFSECINRAPILITSNVNFVKKVIFPLEILPVVALGSAGFQMVVSLIVWVLAHFVLIGPPSLLIALLPVVLLPLVLFVLGVTWWIASLGVFVRDVSQIVNVFVMAMMFLSPIFYPVTAVPAEFQTILTLNPLSTAVEQARAVMFFEEWPDWRIFAISLGAGALTAWLGFAWFQITRKGFADVI